MNQCRTRKRKRRFPCWFAQIHYRQSS